MIKLDKGEKLVGVDRIEAMEDEEGEGPEAAPDVDNEE
jgi:hypothetical protein